MDFRRLLLACTLVGCGGSKTAPAPVKNETPPATPVAAEPPAEQDDPPPPEEEWEGATDDPPPPPDCNEVVEGLHEAGVNDGFRLSATLRACDDGWTPKTFACFYEVKTPADETACVTNLKDAEQRGLQAHQSAADQERALFAAAKKKPATITCAKVAATRYSDARWKTVMTTQAAAEQTKAAAAARKSLTAACTSEKWNADVRACGLLELDACKYIVGLELGVWTLPPFDPMTSTGIADCDVYSATIERLAQCPQLPVAARQAMRDAFRQAAAAWATLPPEVKPQVGAACKAAADATAQAAAASGCP